MDTVNDPRRAMLIRWQQSLLDMENTLDALRPLLSMAPESLLNTHIERVAEVATSAVAKLTGISIDELEWYRFECELGKKQQGVVMQDGASIVVDGLDSFLRTV